jgi:hypothetical protein
MQGNRFVMPQEQATLSWLGKSWEVARPKEGGGSAFAVRADGGDGVKYTVSAPGYTLKFTLGKNILYNFCPSVAVYPKISFIFTATITA